MSLLSKFGRPMLCYTGIETDLIFNKKVDLPGFATFPLLETDEGRELLRRSYLEQVEVAREFGCGVTFETVSWVANKNRAAKLGYGPKQLDELCRKSVRFAREIADEIGDVPILISGQIGPRGDGYRPDLQMDDEIAEKYHSEQMASFARERPDIVSAFTISYPEEAIGIVRAAQTFDLPVAISFTVETDGLLPTGMPIDEALDAVDAATDQYAEYFMINCAHPEHFLPNFDSGPWMQRLAGVVVNASRCSHEELDNASELDDGNPDELAAYMSMIKKSQPHFKIFGGCCGTDMRHMKKIAQAVR